MSGRPRYRNLAKGNDGLFLGPVFALEVGAVMGSTGGFLAPTFDQQPITKQQGSYMAFGVKKWLIDGELTATWIGDGDGPDPATISFDSSAVSTINWGSSIGPEVSSPKEAHICAGNYVQSIAWSDDADVPNTASFQMICGFPLWGANVGNLCPPVFKQAGQYFLGWASFGAIPIFQIQFSSLGATLTNLPFSGGPPYTTAFPDSGVDFDILGVSQSLWNPDAANYSFSGSVSLKAATNGYWTCGGRWDADTGLSP
jgi:hypothetical protein